MLDHGHVDDAVAYLSDPGPGEAYPFDAAQQAMGSRASDDEARLRVFRGAIRAMRDHQSSGGDAGFHHRDHFFTRLFTSHWTRLPAGEATAVVREFVEWILAEPDSRTRASFANGNQRVQFSSTHEQRLFEILGPLRRLDPDLAERVLKGYPHLSAVAAQFPYGQDSMEAATRAEPRPIVREPEAQLDYIEVGQRLMPMPEAIRTEFKDAFAVALELYASDSDRDNINGAPQECWPSAVAFRGILYKAGKHEGPVAARYLERIPDAALRLFAQIELAAALAGLPQLGSRSIHPGPRGLRDMIHRNARPAPSGVPPVMRVNPPPRRPEVPPSRELHVSPATRPAGDGPSGGSGSDFVEIRNVSLKALVAKLYDMPATRIDWPAPAGDLETRYDFVLVLPRPESRETIVQLIKDRIARHFNLRLTTGIKPMDVWILTAPQGISAREARRESPFGSGSFGIGAGSMSAIDIGMPPEERTRPGGLPRIPDTIRLMEIMAELLTPQATEQPSDALGEMLGQMKRQFAALLGPGSWIGGIDASLTIGQLCETIEEGLDRPLVDETGLTGTYAIALHEEVTSTLEFLHTICNRFGLVATAGRRAVRMLTVRPGESPGRQED